MSCLQEKTNLSAVVADKREQAEYSAESAMIARAPCSQFLLALKPTPCIIAKIMEHSGAVPEFDEDFVAQISDYLYSYDDRIYIVEKGGALFGVVPKPFFVSSLALVLKFEMEAGAVLRLLDDSRYKDLFVLSPSITARKARKTKAISDKAEDLDDFFGRLKRCFFDIVQADTLTDTDLVVGALKEACANASLLTGCPATFLKSKTVCEKTFDAGDIDMIMLATFVINVMMLARTAAEDRGIRISFEALSQNMAIIVELDLADGDCSEIISFWTNLAAEHMMPFGAFEHEQMFKIGFQPYRRELSYLGLKQEIDWDFLY